MNKISFAKYCEIKSLMIAEDPIRESGKIERIGFRFWGYLKAQQDAAERGFNGLFSTKVPLGKKNEMPGSALDALRAIKDSVHISDFLTDKVNPAGGAGHNPNGDQFDGNQLFVKKNQKLIGEIIPGTWEQVIVAIYKAQESEPEYRLAA